MVWNIFYLHYYLFFCNHRGEGGEEHTKNRIDNITRKAKDRDVAGWRCHKEHESREKNDFEEYRYEEWSAIWGYFMTEGNKERV